MNCLVTFRFCSLDDEPEETHEMNQSILYNHGYLTLIYSCIFGGIPT